MNLLCHLPMKKKIFLLLLISGCILITATAQRNDSVIAKMHAARNVYLEIGGPGFLSVNYDQRFKGYRGLGIRAGLGLIPGTNASPGMQSATRMFLALPAEINYLAGTNQDFAEFGAGFTVININNGTDNQKLTRDIPSATVMGHITVGYRFQPVHKRMVFRIFLSPIFLKNYFALGYGGISFGCRL